MREAIAEERGPDQPGDAAGDRHEAAAAEEGEIFGQLDPAKRL
jgi:hypothetical protein